MLGTWLFQIAVLLLCLTTSAFFLGEYMARVFMGKKTLLSPLMVPLENFIYGIFRIDFQEDMGWKEFSANFLLFIVLGFLVLFLLQKFQHVLPLNPEKFSSIRWDRAFNGAVSFITNTNWQPYTPEIEISYFTRLVGMGVQNFLSTAAGMAIAVAFINGMLRKNGNGIGNFWVYLTRSILYVLLPLSLLMSIFLMLQGTPNNLNPYVKVKTLEGREQVIAQGPVASQVAIRQLGTSGGGIFAANAAHPYENPTPLTDLVNILALLLIAAAFPFMFGAMIRDRTEGWIIFAAMALLFILLLAISSWSELRGSEIFEKLNIGQGISMEGKELRFGNISTAAFATAATATAGGAANASYVSLMPLTGMMLLLAMTMGEVVFGGIGYGFIGMMFYVVLTMFLIALMIGRSPEIYGKKLGTREMVITVLVLFMPGILQLVLTATAVYIAPPIATAGNQGLIKIFYNYVSVVANNGSSFGTIHSHGVFYNLATSWAMFAGYLLLSLSALAMAGSMVKKNVSPKATHFHTANGLFILLLISVILVISSLSFLPAFALGPMISHLRMIAGIF